jgi:hypothetical protein
MLLFIRTSFPFSTLNQGLTSHGGCQATNPHACAGVMIHTGYFHPKSGGGETANKLNEVLETIHGTFSTWHIYEMYICGAFPEKLTSPRKRTNDEALKLPTIQHNSLPHVSIYCIEFNWAARGH